ncbi:CPBP family intramembrane metalloprotease [Sedimentibacter sp. zth1]|uniref:CPBP family intramembrane glutamic endopeptidase n=1 Tax=Sedimentibacter sp. zth1 TaxID=2816908 RepID=UPI001A91AF40|nr:type II CAAX endopeptidase family protein [Sedimentibacter sp. zth1]QSX06320.1 CPBP family intramembrane metalloprotease [Sedimentibacter sp. zth1]
MENLSKKSPKQTISQIGVALFIFVLIAQAIQFPLVKIMLLFDENVSSQPWFLFVVSAISLYLIGFPIYLILMKKIPTKKLVKPEEDKKYSIKEIITFFLISYTAAILLNLVSTAVNLLISMMKGSEVINPLEKVISGSSIWYVLIFACILAPIMEEIIFRKILIDKLSRFGSTVAIVISAYAFALFHGNLSQLLYAFVLGLIFAYITVKSGTVKYSIILHVLVNFTGSCVPFIVMNLGENAIVVLGIIMWIVVISGIVLFFKKRKVLFAKIGDNVSENEEVYMNGELIYENDKLPLSKAFFNVGMLMFLAISIVMIIFAIMQ